MRFVLMMILVVSFSSSYAQTIKSFVPTGYTILDSAYGDLNKDGISDAAIIFQNDTSRILLMLFKNANGFTMAGRSNSFIIKNDNPAMEEPYQEMNISKGVLQINFQLFFNAGSWDVTNASYKFRYEKNQFVLIGAEQSTVNRATQDSEEYSYNFLTKERTFTKGSKKTWKRIDIFPLKTLNTFSKPFTWEVEKGVFL